MERDLKILVAEDNTDDVFLLEEAFRRAGSRSRLFVVPDGGAAVAYLKGEGPYTDRAVHAVPDILLLDLNMPRMNGFEVLEWIRAQPQWSRLVVHVLSASSRQADIERSYDLRANSYIVKPTRMAQLVEFVSALELWHRLTVLPPRPMPRPELVLG